MVIGGLVSATFLTLVALPLLYIIFSNQGRRGGKTPVVAALLSLCVFWMPQAEGQSPIRIGLPDAIEIAMQHNLQLQADQLKSTSPEP
ncbi:MAG: hypothetical protein IPG32_17795 [Saprospirales bacterium]|nr:hypothetical protein [Saprospirales bacterium]